MASLHGSTTKMRTVEMQQMLRNRIQHNLKIIKARQGLDRTLHCVLSDLHDLHTREVDCGKLQVIENCVDDES